MYRYVLIALVLAAPLEAQEGRPIGDFFYVEDIDAMTDIDRSLIYTESKDAPRLLRSPRIAWRCDGPDMELFVRAGDFLTSDDPVAIQWRFDSKGAAQPTKWDVSTTGTAAFAPRNSIAAFTNEAKGAIRLRVRLTDYGGTPYNYEFSMTGLTSAIERLNCDPLVIIPGAKPGDPVAIKSDDPVVTLWDEVWEEFGAPEGTTYVVDTEAKKYVMITCRETVRTVPPHRRLFFKESGAMEAWGIRLSQRLECRK